MDDMTDEEKSVVLARLAGLEIDDRPPVSGYVIRLPRGGWTSNLYHPQNMELAWQVLNWIMKYPITDDNAYQFVAKFNFSINFGQMMKMPPAKAQRLWLDIILELAIEHRIRSAKETT